MSRALILVAATAALLGVALPSAEARPEVCPSFHPLQPCSYEPTEDGAYTASGSFEVVIVEGDEVTRISGTTEPGEIISDGGLPGSADLITARALDAGSFIIAGSTDCTGCLPGHGDGDGGDDGGDDELRRPGRSGDAPGHTGEHRGQNS